jgi:hypothetical protein
MIGAISLGVAVLGIVGAYFSLRQNYRARLQGFEQKYVERYWSIVERLSLDALKVSNAEPDESDEEVIRRYILLCEDELQMRGKGYISDSTFEEWADGMIGQVKQPMFSAVLEKVNEESREQRGAFPYKNLCTLLDEGSYEISGPGDPLKSRSMVRAVRGLKGIVSA